MKKNSCLKPQGARALIFSIKHHLVNLYQVCSNYTPGVKNGPAGGGGGGGVFMFCID